MALKITDFFNFIKIDEQTHKYYYNDTDNLSKIFFRSSVTQEVSKYHEKFDSNKIAKKTSEKYNIPLYEVLQSWRDKANDGKNIHLLIESYFNENIVIPDNIGIKENIKNLINVFIHKFKNESGYEMIETELKVGDKELKIAGTVDAVVKNRFNEYELWDWKTSGKIHKKAFNNKKMFYPFNDLPDCNYIHYCLQLSFYKFIIERNSDIKISKLRIVHFDCIDNNSGGDNNYMNLYKFHNAIDFSNILHKIK